MKGQYSGEHFMKDKMTIRDYCYIGLFTSLIAIMAQISIPMPAGVPMTLQTFAVPLAGIVLGRKRGFLAAAVYVLLGAVGAPVFAGFTGGIGIILGATGGFIVSFPLMAYLAGLGMEKMSRVYLWGSLIIGAFLNYACGTVWFMAFSGSALQTALMGCVVPFIPTSIVKIILDGTAGPLLRNVLSRAGLIDSRSAS